VVVGGRGGGQRAHPGSGIPVPPLQHPPVSIFAQRGEPFLGPSAGLESMVRAPLALAPREPGVPWGGATATAQRQRFSTPGLDFAPPAEPDIVVGLPARVHVPLLEAGRRTNAEPGVRNYKYVAAQRAGVNTDAAVE
jgi:hypothetical protein